MNSRWPGSSVGIATGYWLDGPGIESRWGGRDFPHLSRPVLGPTQPPVQWVPGLSRGLRAAGAWRWPLTPFWCRGHERVELYLYSPYRPYGLYRASVPVQGCTLPLPLHELPINTYAHARTHARAHTHTNTHIHTHTRTHVCWKVESAGQNRKGQSWEDARRKTSWCSVYLHDEKIGFK